MTPRENLNPPDSSDRDDPPDLIEDNKPEDALKRTDPDKPLLDQQNPESGVSEISRPDNPDTRSPY
jgi:hypothetical protein